VTPSATAKCCALTSQESLRSTKHANRRLARRGGAKGISGLMYDEARGVLKVFIENVVRDAVTYTAHAHRKTVIHMDMVYALTRQGCTLYGFGGTLPIMPQTTGGYKHHLSRHM
jgi:histone H4